MIAYKVNEKTSIKANKRKYVPAVWTEVKTQQLRLKMFQLEQLIWAYPEAVWLHA